MRLYLVHAAFLETSVALFFQTVDILLGKIFFLTLLKKKKTIGTNNKHPSELKINTNNNQNKHSVTLKTGLKLTSAYRHDKDCSIKCSLKSKLPSMISFTLCYWSLEVFYFTWFSHSQSELCLSLFCFCIINRLEAKSSSWVKHREELRHLSYHNSWRAQQKAEKRAKREEWKQHLHSSSKLTASF